MHSVADLTTFATKTTGDVPPQLVGASLTIFGSKLYVFGGRFSVENRMSPDIYELDLHSWSWTKLDINPPEEVFFPRYFHSADSWNNCLIVFGGMGYKEDAITFDKDDLCIYDDLRMFDLLTKSWLPPIPEAPADQEEVLAPGARYAHLSSISGDKLTIIGGQDLQGQWLGDIYVFDLKLRRWITKVPYPKFCGAYRSIAVSSPYQVVAPLNESPESSGFPGVQPQFQLQNAPLQSFRQRAPLVHLPYSELPEKPDDNEVYLYSNYNFTDVKRELVVLRPDDASGVSINDESTTMGGASLPPGLRFPTGAMIGSHILIAGTYLAHTHQSYSIWTLDLRTKLWSRLEPGAVLTSGSWCRGCLWQEANKFLVFGDRNGSLVEDYNRRILSWEDVASIDLEAYGIYKPPELKLDLHAQELGLAALEEELLADFEVVCDDGRRIKCNRKILERRWPWFEQQRRLYLSSASKALESIPKTIADIPLPDMSNGNEVDDTFADPRLCPRSFHLSEPYAITLGFLQYLYSLALITSLQHAPAVLSGLLLLATTYELPHLESLVKHAMHRMLSPQTSVGVYEMATVCDCQNLQIRALKYVMMGSKRSGNRPQQDDGYRRPDGGSGRGGGGGGGGGGGFRGRGLSDPNMRSDVSDSNPSINGAGAPNGRSIQTLSHSQLAENAGIQVSRTPLQPVHASSTLECSDDVDPLLNALETHARIRRQSACSIATATVSYGDGIKVASVQSIAARRGLSYLDTSADDASTSQKSWLPDTSLHPLADDPDEDCDDLDSLDTPTLTRANSLSQHSTASLSPIRSPKTMDSNCVVIADLEDEDRDPGNNTSFMDFYDRESKVYYSHLDPFASTQAALLPTSRKSLRQSISQPILSSALLPSHTTPQTTSRRENWLQMRLRGLSVGSSSRI